MTTNSAVPSSTHLIHPPRRYVRVKVVSLGDAGVGKSCLIKRYCEKKFVPKYISTIGCDFGVRQVEVDGEEMKVNFWDLSGAPDFYEVRNEFHSNAQATLLVYDVNQVSSFKNLGAWMNEHQQFGGKPYITIVCANKTDEGKRVVGEAEGKKWASERGYGYMETSAKSGLNVNELFVALFKGIQQGTKK